MITLMEAKIENCTIFACNVTAWIKCPGSYIFRCGTLAFIGFEDFLIVMPYHCVAGVKGA